MGASINGCPATVLGSLWRHLGLWCLNVSGSPPSVCGVWGESGWEPPHRFVGFVVFGEGPVLSVDMSSYIGLWKQACIYIYYVYIYMCVHNNLHVARPLITFMHSEYTTLLQIIHEPTTLWDTRSHL